MKKNETTYKAVIAELWKVLKVAQLFGFQLKTRSGTFYLRFELSDLSDKIWDNIYSESSFSTDWPTVIPLDAENQLTLMSSTLLDGKELLSAARTPEYKLMLAVQSAALDSVASEYNIKSHIHCQKRLAAAGDLKQILIDISGRTNVSNENPIASQALKRYQAENALWRLNETRFRTVRYFGVDVLDAKINTDTT